MCPALSDAHMAEIIIELLNPILSDVMLWHKGFALKAEGPAGMIDMVFMIDPFCGIVHKYNGG
jgi:hypothetical protein